MKWTEKALRERRNRQVAKQVLNTPEYQEIRRKEAEQATLDAFCEFCFIMCEYLETKHRYGKVGLSHFLEFVNDVKRDMDEDYFIDRANTIKKLTT